MSKNPIHTNKAKRLTFVSQLRIVLLVAVWVSIVIAAHPEGVLSSLGHFLWRGLVPVGMDVSMTPLTADMTLMLDQNEKAFYQRQITFEVLESEAWRKISWNQLSFYGVRVPLLLMLELVEGGVDVKGHVHGICYHLNNPAAFRVRMNPIQTADEKLGLGREWKCL